MADEAAKVKERFRLEGVSIAEWARSRGFNCITVYRVLSGRVKGNRGEAHRIAVALGLKPKARTSRFALSRDRRNAI